MSPDPATTEAVRYWWNKATGSLAAARRDLAAQDFALAMNRAYYAAFYAASALLLEQGKKFKKHTGVRAAFNREVIKAGQLATRHGELYNRLFQDRVSADYVAFAAFDEAYVAEQVQACGALLEDIRARLRSL